MHRKALIIGGVWGFFAPFIGIFLGLQVSTVLGNIFAFPVIGLSYVTGVPFGMWPAWGMLGALLLSIVVWAGLFYFGARLVHRQRA